MKTIISLLIMLQSFAFTGDEFKVTLEKSEIEMKAESSQSLEINIQRFQGFKNAKAKMGLSSPLPQGVTIQFDPAEGVIDKTRVSINVDNKVVAGTYNIILNSTLNHKTKGTILKLIVQ